MNGRDHYREAEYLLKVAANTEQSMMSTEQQGALLAAAQAHAILALTAAAVATRAIGPVESWGGHVVETSGEWREATDE